MRTKLRRASLIKLLLTLAAVAILAATACSLIPIGGNCYIGLNTATVKTERSLLGVVLSATYSRTPLTACLEKHLGPLPAETEWLFAYGCTPGIFHANFDGFGGDLRAIADYLPEYVDPRNTQRPPRLDYEMTEAAKQKVLRNYIKAVHVEVEHRFPRMYVVHLIEVLLSLDRPALPEDIPPVEDVRDEQVWKTKWEPKIDANYEAWAAQHPDSQSSQNTHRSP